MKIAYVAHVGARSNGVIAKTHSQVEIWQQMGHNARLFCVSEASPPGDPAYFHWKHCNLLNPLKPLLDDLDAFAPNLVYWRPNNATLHTLCMMRRFAPRIVIEVNSNYRIEGREYARKRGTFSELRTYYQNLFAESLITPRIAGYVCVTHELAALPDFSGQKNRITIPNGILLKNTVIHKQPQGEGPIRLLFMGSPGQSWHGVDVLPELAKKMGTDFHVHVIGPRADQMGAAVLPENMTLHGYLDKADYLPLLAQMHVGIGSMAFYRNKMLEACPLKVREYIASGLPVILPYTDTAFRDECPDWVLRLPNEEGAFHDAGVINAIRQFCFKHRDTVVSHQESAPYIDSKALESDKLKQVTLWVKAPQ